jgi:ubiquinone/menaquinone biosynthesis C-methylase UbiE
MTALDLGCGLGVFTLPMARMVGDTGRVVAVDLQQEALDQVVGRAEKDGLASRIEPRRCEAESLCIDDLAGRVGFALAFWMVHEVPDAGRFFAELRAAMVPGGHVWMAEPIFHVSKKGFEASIEEALERGFREVARPRVAFSRAVVLQAVEGN